MEDGQTTRLNNSYLCLKIFFIPVHCTNNFEILFYLYLVVFFIYGYALLYTFSGSPQPIYTPSILLPYCLRETTAYCSHMKTPDLLGIALIKASMHLLFFDGCEENILITLSMILCCYHDYNYVWHLSTT